jgi:hypothetical protein
MPNLPKRKFSINLSLGKPAPLTETIDGESKIIAFCDSDDMAKGLISRITLLESFRYELEYIVENNLPADQIHDRIKSTLRFPPDFYKD